MTTRVKTLLPQILKISCSMSETNENLQNFQKIIFMLKLILWRHRVQFSILIPLTKTFSPSTVNVRSKFWRIWEKREVSKVLIFDWSCDTKTAIFNFDIPAETFFAKNGKCSFKNLKNLKWKSEFSKVVFITQSVPLET